MFTTVLRPLVASAAIWFLLGGAVVGCDGDDSTNSDSDASASADASAGDEPDAYYPGAFVPCPGAEEPGPTGLVGDDLRREGFAGNASVAVVFCNPLVAQPRNDDLLFYIFLTDHFGLEPSDFIVGTTVTTGPGVQTDGPFRWEGDDLTIDDHHAKGHFYSPGHLADGTPLIGADAQYLELSLAGVAGGNTVLLRWENEYLH